jgi:hypothetical protein
MRSTSVVLAVAALLTSEARDSSAALSILGQFDPANAGSLCGLAYDPFSQAVWIYGCSGTSIQEYSRSGSYLNAVVRPGEPADDVDVEAAPEILQLGVTLIPAVALLFVNGESGFAEIYAVDNVTGLVLATLQTSFGASHVVGGAYHPGRNTIFLLQDRVPVAAERNRIAEIDPTTGSVLGSFQITGVFDINFGDIEVCASTGNLLVVSSIQTSLAEYTPGGALVQLHALPVGVASLSGIGHDDETGEAWVGGTRGSVWQLGGVPCGVVSAEGELDPIAGLRIARPNPATRAVTLGFVLAEDSPITIRVYDVAGRRVRTLVEGERAAGTHEVTWNARDDRGYEVGAGTYFCRVTARDWHGTRTIVIVDR